MKGGYKIIDLKGTDFTLSTGVTITGVHNKVENNYFKALMLENYSIAEVEQVAEFVTFAPVGGNLVATLASGNTITITSADLVTIAPAQDPTMIKAKTTTK